MSARMFLSAVGFVAATAATGLAALATNWVEWGKGPAQHLMAADESSRWKTIGSDADADVFVKSFWARRDPSPGTERNEVRDEFEARVKYADQQFSAGAAKGSMTDRGRMLILFGPPSRVVPFEKKQTWIYEGPLAAIFDGRRTEVAFVDYLENGDLRFERGNAFDIRKWQQRVVDVTLQAQAPEPVAPAAVPVADVPPSRFANEIATFRAKQSAGLAPLFVEWGEFQTVRGESFVPVSLYVPKSAGLDASHELTFFGVVENESGAAIAVVEEPAKLSASKDDLFFDKSLALPPGKHVGTFGLARNGKPVAMATATMELAGPVSRGTPGISRLILSNNVYALTAAQLPTDPFAFGGVKVVPKADRTFSRADELWYFFELRHPGYDEQRIPRVQVRLDLEGTAASGTKVARTSPSRPMDAQEMKGVPGHYGIGSAIPLGTLEPGEYTLRIKVTDTVRKTSYNLQDHFRVLAEGK